MVGMIETVWTGYAVHAGLRVDLSFPRAGVVDVLAYVANLLAGPAHEVSHVLLCFLMPCPADSAGHEVSHVLLCFFFNHL